MKLTKIYTRDDMRKVWRRYQRGDMNAGNDFALIAHAQGKPFKALQAEIEAECRAEDEQATSAPEINTRATPEQRRRAGIMLWEQTRIFKERQPELSDRAAFRLALDDNPTLAEQYTGFPMKRNG